MGFIAFTEEFDLECRKQFGLDAENIRSILIDLTRHGALKQDAREELYERARAYQQLLAKRGHD